MKCRKRFIRSKYFLKLNKDLKLRIHTQFTPPNGFLSRTKACIFEAKDVRWPAICAH